MGRGRPGSRADMSLTPGSQEPGESRHPEVTGWPSVPASFEGFYEEHYRAVVAIAAALTASRSAAEELAQDAFLSAHRQWDRVCQHERPDLWIRRVVANLAASRMRRLGAEGRALFRLSGLRARESPVPDVKDRWLWREVRALPARQSQALILHYVDDRSLREIAEILGCAEGTVKTHLARGRATLAQRLSLDLPHQEDT